MIQFEVAFPIKQDAELALKWRNDPVTLAMSFTHREKVSFETFFPRYLKSYFTLPSLPPLFATVDGERIALLRFDPADPIKFSRCSCEISIVVAPEKRNQGWGTKVLLALEPFLKRQGVSGVGAQILAPNIASQKTFLKSGYTLLKEGDVLYLEKLFQTKKEPVFIIAEAGSNWYVEGDSKGLERGRQLIEAAKIAGADAVKFQTFRAKDIYVPNPGGADYLEGHDIKDLFEALEMPEEMIFQMAEHCKKCGIEFMSSVFSPRDFALIDPLVSRHKIASYEINYQELITLAARSKKPTILSTGASNTNDIDWAVSLFQENGGGDLTLLQCTAKYPALPGTMNLDVIPWLKARYQVKSGLSDHSLDAYQAPLAAVALGATCIEKHFTLSRKLSGPDHGFALEPEELKSMVASIRAVEEMKGTPYKNILESEEELYLFCRRGIQALHDIRPGEILKNGKNIAVLRPGKRSVGLHPKYLSEVDGKKTVDLIKQGEGIQFLHMEQR